MCKNENKYIDINQYISFNKEDNLYKIKKLILFVIEKEKSFSYNFIKINHAVFVPYLDPNSLDELKLIREIYTELVVLGQNDESFLIEVQESIHKLGIKLVKLGKLKGDELLLFLGQEEILYNEMQIKILKKENQMLKDENMGIKQDINNLYSKSNKLENKIETINTDISCMKNNLNGLSSQIEKVNREVSSIKQKLMSLDSNSNPNL